MTPTRVNPKVTHCDGAVERRDKIDDYVTKVGWLQWL